MTGIFFLLTELPDRSCQCLQHTSSCEALHSIPGSVTLDFFLLPGRSHHQYSLKMPYLLSKDFQKQPGSISVIQDASEFTVFLF